MIIFLIFDLLFLNVMSNKINFKIIKFYKENRFFGVFFFFFNVGFWCKCDIKIDEVVNIWIVFFLD